MYDQNQETALQLANDLPAALEAATGQSWTVAHQYDVNGDGCLIFSKLTQAATDTQSPVTIHMTSGGWNDKDKAKFSIASPSDCQGRRRGWGELPGTAYGTSAPETKAALSRPAKAVAGQIVRNLLAADILETLNRVQKYDADRAADVAESVRWRDAVAVASGIDYRESTHNDEIYFPSASGQWGGISCSKHAPGGRIELRLPKNPEKAAEIVAKLRAIMEGAGE